MTEDEIGKLNIDVAVQIHRGPGCSLLETVYDVAQGFPEPLTGSLKRLDESLGTLGVLARVNSIYLSHTSALIP